MSDNTIKSEQQQQMQEIFIPADVWLKVFAFISPLELGLKIALISDRFDALVDEHFKSRKWSLGLLSIHRATDGNGAQIVNRSGEQLPIPQGSLPRTVVGFNHIEISYVDQSVIEFLQRIRRLFNNSSGTTVAIHTAHDQSRSWEIIRQKIWPFVNDNICRVLLFNSSQLGHLRQFSPAILRNCPNLRSIVSDGLFPEFPAEDNADASARQAATKWLLTPRGDGPKMINYIFIPQEMCRLKGAFVNASEPVNFIVRLSHSAEFDVIKPFELKNNLTRERLALRLIGDVWLLVCCPIGREEDKWAKWEEEAIGWEWSCQWNRISIDFDDSDIGDDMDDAKAGPSEPKK
ncbi:hypothetical protein GPALN_014637 [Globodera pallida]|uniref:F-box domain-containing protein n=1 Tax=Globodera pallida TaxID=36090 RepID=A0A183CFY6_GLOPA|nr:hypothetical protein GPALN_014637 [Globodera pallida]